MSTSIRKQIELDIKKEVSTETTIQEFCEDKDYTISQVLYRFNTWTNAKVTVGIDTQALQCEKCGTYAENLSSHWSKCGEPELSEHQKSLLVGMLLSDGTVNKSGGFTAYSSNEEYMEWFSNELEFMAYDPYLNDTGENRKQRNERSGFDTRDNTDYKDVFGVSSPVHSFTKELRNKFYNPNKRVPQDLTLDRTILRIWYCGDGGLNWDYRDRSFAEIRSLSFDKESVERLFEPLPFDPSISSSGEVRFNSETDAFLDYISPSPKGMEYKWETEDRDVYEKLI